MLSRFCHNPDCQSHALIVYGSSALILGVMGPNGESFPLPDAAPRKRHFIFAIRGHQYFSCDDCLDSIRAAGRALLNMLHNSSLAKDYGIDPREKIPVEKFRVLIRLWKKELNFTRSFNYSDGLGGKRRFINAPVSRDFRAIPQINNRVLDSFYSDVMQDQSENPRFILASQRRFPHLGLNTATGLLRLYSAGLVSRDTVNASLGF